MFTCNEPTLDLDRDEWGTVIAEYHGYCTRPRLHRGPHGDRNSAPIETVARPTRLAVILTVVFLCVGFFLAGQAQAQATVGSLSEPWVQPYGGCKEGWQAPRSEGADECRAHGWVVRRHLVVNPHGVVRYSTLKWCAVEDASNGPVPCSWNFGAVPPGAFAPVAFYVTGTNDRNRAHYVWASNPTKDTRREWVSRSLADALAESSALRATTRDWRQCTVKNGATTMTVACPDGYHQSW